jgi:hypothetical protein
MDLFLDSAHPLEFEKISMPVTLSDDPAAWQRDVASEIFKQVPFIGDYAVNVVIERVNPERGYGFGSAEVSSKSQAPEPEQESLPKVKIPLIIKDRQLQPLDVFMDGEKVYPLTEARMHEHLFRTATFETSTRKPEDRGMSDQLYPPMRTNYGNNMMSQGEGVMGKFAEAEFVEALNAPEKPKKKRDIATQIREKLAEGDPMAYARKLKAEGSAQKFAGIGEEEFDLQASSPMPKTDLLSAISHTVPNQEVDGFISSVTSDPVLKTAALKNPTFERALLKIAGFQSVSVEKTAEALVDAIKPNVVQFVKLADGNWKLKYANTDAYKPREATMGPDQVSQITGGGDKIQEKGPGGTVTLSTNAAQKTSLENERIEVINHFGFWKVWDAGSNQELFGWAIPVIDLEMHPLPLFVFLIQDGRFSIQDEIAGQQLQEGIDSFPPGGGTPQGDGIFLTPDMTSPMALGPLTIQNGAAGPDGAQELHASTAWGEPVILMPTPGINAIQATGDGSYALPAEMNWHPLQGEPVALATSPLDVENVDAGQKAPNTVDVGSTGQGEYSLGGAPVEKLAAEERRFIKKADAEFLLVGMGMNPFEARDVLARAEKGEKVKIAGLRTITPLSIIHEQMTKKASQVLEAFPYHLRRNLVKIAAALEDTETTDKILAMNFINPENIATFASYLPELDETSSKLAEMLVAARLGMQQIPEQALESAMHNLEEVLEGLKSLQQKQLV